MITFIVNRVRDAVALAGITIAATGLLAIPAHAGTISTTTTPVGALSLIGAGSTQIKFDSLAPGKYANFTNGGVTFTANAGGSIYANSDYANVFNTFGQSIANTYAADAFTKLTFNFASATSGFGFFFGASDSSWILTAYDASSAVIDSLSISPVFASNAGNFFGITGSNISSATLVQAGSGDYVFVDDFTYVSTAAGAVPEPAIWAMMILGFAAVGCSMRGRRRVSTVNFA
jgi:hypothetical protein